jgi:hypothetical protein
VTTTLDFTPAVVNLRLQAGDDENVICTFDTSLTGYTDWSAKIQSGHSDGTLYAFTIDSSGQASQIIALSLSAAQTALIPNRSKWQFQVTDPNGKVQTLMGGGVQVEADVNV